MKEVLLLLAVLLWIPCYAFQTQSRRPLVIRHDHHRRWQKSSASRRFTDPSQIHRRHVAHRLLTSTISPSQDELPANNNNKLPALQRKLSVEFLRIGGPAFLQLAAEPLASLVDTAYLGRLGPDVLGGAGVAISAQYAVSKLYNDPLLRTSISLVASQDGRARNQQSLTKNDEGDSSSTSQSTTADDAKAQLSIAVSSALLLAGTVGLIQMLVYAVGCQAIVRSMGLTPNSGMWDSAVSYLQVRAFGTPAATLWLVANGIFRGLGDTQTPLIYSLMFTLLNAVLDPLFIFVFGWGASGAAAGTALAQYVALIPLLLALHQKVPIHILGQFRQLGGTLQEYLKAGSLVLVRTLGKVLAYAVCARQAALLGSVAAAAYNLTFQLGFATTQICEAVAVAVQTLLAREFADTKSHSAATRAKLIRHLVRFSVGLGGLVATTLSLSTYWRRDWILSSLTTNVQIQAAATTIFPAVLLTQVLKGLAYPVNGILMGGLDWFFSMAAMWLANGACVGLIWYGKQGGKALSLEQIWWALAAFMGTQVVTGILRYQSKTGVWKALKAEDTL
jgi:putative MATE family efflux protein